MAVSRRQGVVLMLGILWNSAAYHHDSPVLGLVSFILLAWALVFWPNVEVPTDEQ